MNAMTHIKPKCDDAYGEWVKLSDLSLKLGLDSKTLSSYARRGKLPDARKLAQVWELPAKHIPKIRAKYGRDARPTEAEGLLTTTQVALYFGVVAHLISCRYFLERTGLDRARRYKKGRSWMWNPFDVLKAKNGGFRHNDWVKTAVVLELKLHGVQTALELCRGIGCTRTSAGQALQRMEAAGLCTRGPKEGVSPTWKLTRLGLETL